MSMTGVGFATQANTNIKALKAANDYCSKIGRHMVPQHSSESGVYGWSPRQNSLVFMCVDENSPAYTQVKGQRPGRGTLTMSAMPVLTILVGFGTWIVAGGGNPCEKPKAC